MHKLHINLFIKTHGNVSCGPRSWCAIPQVYWYEERRHDFHIYVALWSLIGYRGAHHVSNPTYHNERNCYFQDKNYQNLNFFLHFFPIFSIVPLLFTHFAKLAIKHKHIVLLSWNLEHIKGSLKYHLWCKSIELSTIICV